MITKKKVNEKNNTIILSKLNQVQIEHEFPT